MKVSNELGTFKPSIMSVQARYSYRVYLTSLMIQKQTEP